MSFRKETKKDTKPIYPNKAEAYELIEVIGVGSNAKVYRARCKEPHLQNEDVAIKIIDLEKYPSSLEAIRKEIQIMSQSSHPNIVNFYTSFVNNTNLYTVMELFEGGSVADIMKYRYPNGLDDEDLIATILKQVLLGIEYFHKNGQIHRDIKASNILIDPEGKISIGDFGGSAWVYERGDNQQIRHTFVGTPCWMAPEVLEQLRGYDYRADIWSFGITAIELACGKPPFSDFPPMKVMMLVLQQPPPTLDSCTTKKFSKQFKDMIDVCLKKDPLKRPTASQLLKHRFFSRAKPPQYIAKFFKDTIALGERARKLQSMEESKEENKEKKRSWSFDFSKIETSGNENTTKSPTTQSPDLSSPKPNNTSPVPLIQLQDTNLLLNPEPLIPIQSTQPPTQPRQQNVQPNIQTNIQPNIQSHIQSNVDSNRQPASPPQQKVGRFTIVNASVQQTKESEKGGNVPTPTTAPRVSQAPEKSRPSIIITKQKSQRNFEVRPVDREELNEISVKTKASKSSSKKKRPKKALSMMPIASPLEMQRQLTLLMRQNAEQMRMITELYESHLCKKDGQMTDKDVLGTIAKLELQVKNLMEENNKLKMENTMLRTKIEKLRQKNVENLSS